MKKIGSTEYSINVIYKGDLELNNIKDKGTQTHREIGKGRKTESLWFSMNSAGSTQDWVSTGQWLRPRPDLTGEVLVTHNPHAFL